jgi:hypothetical protein
MDLDRDGSIVLRPVPEEVRPVGTRLADHGEESSSGTDLVHIRARNSSRTPGRAAAGERQRRAGALLHGRARALKTLCQTGDLPLETFGYDNIERGLLPMEKNTIITRTPPLPKAPRRTEPPVRTMSMDKAKSLIRKTSSEHAGLFRRLAK